MTEVESTVAPPPDPLWSRTLANLQALTPHERSALWLVEDADTLRLVAGRNLAVAIGAVAPAAELEARQDVILSASGFTAGLVAPLRDADVLVGALALARAEPFDELTTRQIQAFANQVALLFHDPMSDQDQLARRRAREFAAFSDIAATLNQSLDLDTILRDTLRHTLAAAGMESGWVWLVDPAAAVARVVATYGLSPDAIADQREIDLHGIDLGAIANQLDQAVVLNDPARLPQLVQMVMRAQGLRAYVSIPLVAKDRLQGMINAFSYEDRWLGPDDVRLLTAIGRQVGMAIENARLYAEMRRLYEREAHRVEQLRVISEVGREASSSLEAEPLLRRVVRLIHDAFDYDRVSVALVEGDEVVVRASVGERGVPPPTGIRLQVGQEDTIGRVAARGQPLLVRNAARPGQGEAPGTVELAVPLRAQDRVIGVLDVQSDDPAALSEDDLAVLSPLANQVGVAIENARLYEEMRRQLAETTTLYRVSRAINSTPDLETMLEHVLDESLEAMQAERGYVLLRDEATGNPVFKVGRARGQESIAPNQAEVHPATVERTMTSGAAVVAVEAPASGPGDGSRRNLRAILCVPLIIKGQVSGVIYVDNRLKTGQFSPERRDLLVGVAAQVAMAIENARLYAQIEALAASRERNRIAQEIHDTLTQQLSSVIMSLEASDRLLMQRDLERSLQQLDRARDLGRAALHDLRQYMFDLRRGEVGELGLVTMLRQLVREFALQTGLQAEFSVDGPEITLDERANRALLRVLQEALANVRKHAQAQRVTVQLAFSEGTVALDIVDDGIGFDLWAAREKALVEKRFGLVGMQERLASLGGRLVVRSQEGQGAHITATLPIARS